MKTVIKTTDAPAAIGPYSQGIKVKCGEIIFCSGQLPMDPKTGEIVGVNAAEQAKRSLENMKAVVEAGGATLADVVKVNVYLADMGDFAAVNEVYATYFKEDPPARAAVAVRTLPKEVMVEIECVAMI